MLLMQNSCGSVNHVLPKLSRNWKNAVSVRGLCPHNYASLSQIFLFDQTSTILALFQLTKGSLDSHLEILAKNLGFFSKNVLWQTTSNIRVETYLKKFNM